PGVQTCALPICPDDGVPLMGVSRGWATPAPPAGVAHPLETPMSVTPSSGPTPTRTPNPGAPAARRGALLAGLLGAAVAAALALPGAAPAGGEGGGLTPEEQLGKAIFFDTNLSTPAGQPCASCHDPATGSTGPSSETNAAG